MKPINHVSLLMKLMKLMTSCVFIPISLLSIPVGAVDWKGVKVNDHKKNFLVRGDLLYCLWWAHTSVHPPARPQEKSRSLKLKLKLLTVF